MIRTGETALVQRASRGDHEAFSALVDARLAATFRTCLAILGNEADARDATQEIFLRAWRSLPELREPDRFAAWFGRIVVNTCRTAIRGRRRRIVREISVGALPGDGDQLVSGESPHDVRTADLDLLERALDRLSLADRTLLKRRDFTVLLGTPSRSPIIAEREVLEVMKRQLQVTERLL